MTQDTHQGETPQGRFITAKVPVDVHREIRIESAHLGISIGEVIAVAWKAYKAANPQPWREHGERQTRRAS